MICPHLSPQADSELIGNLQAWVCYSGSEKCLLLLVRKKWNWELTSSRQLTLIAPHLHLYLTLPLPATVNKLGLPSLSSPVAHLLSCFIKITLHYSWKEHFTWYFPLHYDKRKRNFGS